MIRFDEITDLDTIRNYCSDPDLFTRITNGAVEFDAWYPSDQFSYLGAFDGDKLVGFFSLKPFSLSAFEVHINIRPEHRKSYSREMGWSFLAWFISKTSDQWQTLVALVPQHFGDVCGFVRKFGLRECGRVPDGDTVNGEQTDLVIYSISKADATLKMEGSPWVQQL